MSDPTLRVVILASGPSDLAGTAVRCLDVRPRKVEARRTVVDLEMLRTRLSRGEAIVAGVLSGTSADGIDVGLVRFPALVGGTDLGPPELLAFQTLPFEDGLAYRVRAVLEGEPCDLRAAALLHRDLGVAFGRAAREVAGAARLGLDLVGSHGQTVYHHDEVEPSGPATLQLGDGDFVAEAARTAVVSDFRQRDVAAGGSGAPISALADGVLFGQLARPLAILNLGGISNLTCLPGEQGELLSFDCGPAGALLDGLARSLLQRRWDEGGRVASAGRADEQLVARFLDHPFAARPVPKSTGRDTFGAPFVREFLTASEGQSVPDRLATAVEIVAGFVASGLVLAGLDRPPSGELLMAGGGARNLALAAALGRRTGLLAVSTAAHGIDPDAREALVFAVLAARAVLGLESTVTSATGARAGEVLGKLSFAPRESP